MKTVQSGILYLFSDNVGMANRLASEVLPLVRGDVISVKVIGNGFIFRLQIETSEAKYFLNRTSLISFVEVDNGILFTVDNPNGATNHDWNTINEQMVISHLLKDFAVKVELKKNSEHIERASFNGLNKPKKGLIDKLVTHFKFFKTFFR